jgi:chromosome partitioning protein
MMPVISFASPKGGVGKSTSALLLATGLTAAGASVTVIDGDPNRTVEGWATSAENPGFKWLRLPSDDEIIDAIEEAAEKTQFVIVDLEGTANLAMARAISRTDLVIIPLQASPVDARQASRAIKMVMAQAKELRREISYRMLFTRINPAIATRDEKEIRSQFQEASIPALKVALNERAAFRAMFTHYQSLWDLHDDAVNGLGKAKANATEFVREVTQTIRDLRAAGQGQAA